jgi:hypothetical protein
MSHGVNYQCKSKRSSERPRVREVHEMPTEKLAPGQQGRAAIFVNNHLPGVKNNVFRWSRRRPEMQAARSSEKRKKNCQNLPFERTRHRTTAINQRMKDAGCDFEEAGVRKTGLARVGRGGNSNLKRARNGIFAKGPVEMDG